MTPRRRLSWRAALTAAMVLAGIPAHAQDQGKLTPLFAEDAPLAIRIDGPLREIVRQAERSTEAKAGTLVVGDESLPITIAARGNSRRSRSNCRFPPLMVSLVDKPGDASLFDRQRNLKLVTHCRDTARYQQVVLREYAAYRLYNVLTPESLRVRLLRVTYADGGKDMAESWGFFIEDIDDAARRVGGKEIDIDSLPAASLDAGDAARYALFQYLIGNTDWDMVNGPPGSACCHNSKLVGEDKDARTALTPVPYDFDNAGLVNAPHAVPAAVLPIRSVRQRYFRGYCRFEAETRAAAPGVLAARPALERELAAIPGLDADTRADMAEYLAEFFAAIASPAAMQEDLLSTCR